MPIAMHLGAELLEDARARCPSTRRSRSPRRSEGPTGPSRSLRGCGARSAPPRRRAARPSRRPSAEASSSASIASSSSSVSLRPSPSKSLTPLYGGGLCDAETTAPRSSASRATAGVGSTPARTAVQPADEIPRASAASSSGPDPRVSRPMRTRPGSDPFRSRSGFPAQSVGRAADLFHKGGVRSSPTMPRIPSVPK